MKYYIKFIDNNKSKELYDLDEIKKKIENRKISKDTILEEEESGIEIKASILIDPVFYAKNMNNEKKENDNDIEITFTNRDNNTSDYSFGNTSPDLDNETASSGDFDENFISSNNNEERPLTPLQREDLEKKYNIYLIMSFACIVFGAPIGIAFAYMALKTEKMLGRNDKYAVISLIINILATVAAVVIFIIYYVFGVFVDNIVKDSRGGF